MARGSVHPLSEQVQPTWAPSRQTAHPPGLALRPGAQPGAGWASGPAASGGDAAATAGPALRPSCPHQGQTKVRAAGGSQPPGTTPASVRLGEAAGCGGPWRPGRARSPESDGTARSSRGRVASDRTAGSSEEVGGEDGPRATPRAAAAGGLSRSRVDGLDVPRAVKAPRNGGVSAAHTPELPSEG